MKRIKTKVIITNNDKAIATSLHSSKTAANLAARGYLILNKLKGEIKFERGSYIVKVKN